MQRKMSVPDGYYDDPFCVRCKSLMSDEELAKRKKEGFLRLCEACYTPMKESLKRCLPLMQKFSQR